MSGLSCDSAACDFISDNGTLEQKLQHLALHAQTAHPVQQHHQGGRARAKVDRPTLRPVSDLESWEFFRYKWANYKTAKSIILIWLFQPTKQLDRSRCITLHFYIDLYYYLNNLLLSQINLVVWGAHVDKDVDSYVLVFVEFVIPGLGPEEAGGCGTGVPRGYENTIQRHQSWCLVR